MSDLEVSPVETMPAEESALPRQPAAPIESRFLFVDVAALRAKQIRRGAKPRLPEFADVEHSAKTLKAERVAMTEVRQGLVDWDLPDFKAVFDTR